MNKTELKKTVTKIKKLLGRSDHVSVGVELARGLGEPAVFEALLGGWSINEEGSLTLEEGYADENLTKKWSDKSLPYFEYALWSLIGYAPEGAKVHPSLVRSNITKLVLRGGGDLQAVDALANYTQLTSLDLSGCRRLGNVDGLANCTQLTDLNLSMTRSKTFIFNSNPA